MTSGELKFALTVEKILNRIPQPEYRQLMVEALMVVTLVSENEWKLDLKQPVHIDKVVHEANSLYLKDQVFSTHIFNAFPCLYFVTYLF